MGQMHLQPLYDSARAINKLKLDDMKFLLPMCLLSITAFTKD